MNIEKAIKIIEILSEYGLYCEIKEEYQEAMQVVLSELEKKDRIIDLMSKYIYKREDNTINIGKIYCPLQDCDDINREVNCDTCIKQYFEKKVEEQIK